MKNHNLVLKEIERVYNHRNCQQGILLLEFEIYYPYNEPVKLSYMLIGNDKGSLPTQQMVTNKPYPNKKSINFQEKLAKKFVK